MYSWRVPDQLKGAVTLTARSDLAGLGPTEGPVTTWSWSDPSAIHWGPWLILAGLLALTGFGVSRTKPDSH